MKVSKHTQLLIVAILAVLFLGAWTIPIFPDPYYHQTNVTFIEWLRRELVELIHGEPA